LFAGRGGHDLQQVGRVEAVKVVNTLGVGVVQSPIGTHGNFQIAAVIDNLFENYSVTALGSQADAA
jgi:hypothetical protein